MTGRSKRLIDIGLPSIVLSLSNFFQIVLQAFASRHYVFKQETKLMLLVEVFKFIEFEMFDLISRGSPSPCEF